MVSASFIQGAALLNLQTVSQAVLTADANTLLPWAWEVGDSIEEVARHQAPSDHFFKGVSSLIHTVDQRGNVPCDDAKRKLVEGLTSLGDYRWSQAVLLGVIRGESWARDLPVSSTAHEATAQASRHVKLFSKSTIGLMQEISRGKRKEVRVIPLRLDSAIQIGLAKKFLRQRHLHTDPDKLLRDFDKVISGLRARGARFYYFDLGAMPSHIDLWKKLLDDKRLISLSYDDLRVIFNLSSKGWSGEEKLSLISCYPDQIRLYRRALLYGYDFLEALDFCLKSPDPARQAKEIEGRIEAFREGRVVFRKFSVLSEADKIALYALTKPVLGIGLRQKPFLPYFWFLRDLEIYLSLGAGGTAQVIAPFSDFARLSRWEWGPRKNESPYNFFANIFEALKKNRKYREPLKRFHQALADNDHRIPYAALRTVADSVHCEKKKLPEIMETASILHETNLKLPPAIEELIYYFLLKEEFPLQTTSKFIDHLRRYRENSLVDKSWAEMTDAERLALLAATADHWPKGEKGPEFPAFDDFGLFANLEWAYVVSSGNPVSLKEFAANIATIQSGLRPQAKLKTMFSHPFMKTWSNKPEKLARLRKGLLRGNKLLNRSFAKNRKGIGRADILEAALELFERGYAMDGELFQRYATAPGRQRQLEEVESRAKRLAAGSATGDLEDPFEVLAILRLLRDTEDPVLGSKSVAEILGRVKQIPLDPSVDLASVHFKATSQRFLIHETVDKNLIRELAGEIIDNLSYVDVVKKLLSAPPELGLIPRGIFPKIWEYLRVSSNAEMLELVLKWNNPYGLEEPDDIGEIDRIEAGKVCHLIIKTMAQQETWNPKTLKILLMVITSEESLFAASRKRIQSFHMDLPPAKLEQTLDELRNFFELEFMWTVGKIRHWLTRLSITGRMEENFTSGERKKLSKIFAKIEQLDIAEENVILLPSRDKVDALFGHVSENCLAKDPEYAIYGFTDPTFLPLRILINGEWRGTIMTFTRQIEGHKVLILSGIDPQIPFKPNQFLDRLGEKFAELAERGGYDLVLLTAGRGTISSRRAFLEEEALDRYKKIKLNNKIPIVKRAEGNEATEKNFYGLHNQFLVVVDRR